MGQLMQKLRHLLHASMKEWNGMRYLIHEWIFPVQNVFVSYLQSEKWILQPAHFDRQYPFQALGGPELLQLIG